MATKLARKLQKIFGSTAGFNQQSKIGSLAAGVPEFTTDVEAMQSNGNYLGGWFSTVLGGNSPAIQDMNALDNLITYQLAYLMQSGVAEWNADTTYFIGSLAMVDGRLYSSIGDDNLNYPVTDSVKWSAKNPMIAAGDLIIGDILGVEKRLPVGLEGDVLTVASGVPVWSQGVPPGTIFEFAGVNVPSGYLALGQPVSRATYANLFGALGCAFGIGDGATTFDLPPVGYFSRPYGSTLDPDAAARTSAVAGFHSISGGSTVNASPNVTVSSTENLSPGMTVSGTGIPAGAVVRSITSATKFKLGDAANSTFVNATAAGTGQIFSFSRAATGNYIGSVQPSDFGSHNHSQNPHAHHYLSKYSGPYSATGGSFLEGTNDTITSAEVATNNPSGGNETRPINININKIIKY